MPGCEKEPDTPDAARLFGIGYWPLFLSAVPLLLSVAVLISGAVGFAADNRVPVSLSAPLGLPPVPVPPENPLTRAKIDLGRKLFMDRRLSPNHTMSCAMCHVPEQGFTSNELGGAVGIEGRSHRRNAPTVYNVAYFERLFHDGREFALENQVWGPLLARNEMGNPSIGYVIEQIERLPDYRGLFQAAFDGRGPSAETIGAALASYERTLVSANSRFDRWRYGGEKEVLTAEEREGFALFTGKARCSTCHSIGTEYALFTDQRFHNTGIGWQRSMGTPRTFGVTQPQKYKVQLAPGIYAEIDEEIVASISQPEENDVGRYEVTQDTDDRWAYRTPSLRNIALTAPYMHDGAIPTLEEVIEFYDQGGIDNPAKSSLLQPLGLTAGEKRSLAAFLRTLTGDNIDALVQDARRAEPSLPGGRSPRPVRQGEQPPSAYR